MSEELQRKLKEARKKLGLSQSQAAQKWGVPKATLQAWEQDRNTPTGFTLQSLMVMLDEILED